MPKTIDSLIDIIFTPVTENLLDKKDLIVSKILIVLQTLLISNFFCFRIESFLKIFEFLKKLFFCLKLESSNLILRSVFLKCFDAVVQRVTLQSYIFVSENPLRVFYSDNTKKFINIYNQRLVKNLVDRVVLNDINVKENTSYLVYYGKTHLKTGKDEAEYKTEIENEIFEKPGKTGWCFLCRKRAEFLCLQTRLPICSLDCKLQIILDENILEKCFEINSKEYKREINFYKSYLKIFEWFTSSVIKSKEEKEKLFFLEILSTLFKNCPKSLNNLHSFISYIKKDFFENILFTDFSSKNSLFLKYTLSIFLHIFTHFRPFIKDEIFQFIKTNILFPLNNKAIKFEQKFFLIHLTKILIEEKFFIFEIFLNFDCVNESENLCENIIDIIVKIAEGKFREEENKESMKNESILILEKNAIFSFLELIKRLKLYFKKNNKKGNNENVKKHENSIIGRITEKELVNVNIKMKEEIKTYFEKIKINKEKNNLKGTEISKNEKMDESFWSELKKENNEEINSFNKTKEDSKNTEYLEKKKTLLKNLKKGENFISSFNQLLELNCFEYDPDNFLHFLKKENFLKKTLCGFLTIEGNFFDKLAEKFSENFSFQNKDFLDCLNEYFSSFEIILENKKIEKIVKLFCWKFCKDKSLNDFRQDFFYIVYAIVILDINLHNPKISHRFSFQEFSSFFENTSSQIQTFLSQEKLFSLYQEIIKKSFISIPFHLKKEKMQQILTQNYQETKKHFSIINLNDFEKAEKNAINKNFKLMKDIFHMKLFFSTFWKNFQNLFKSILSKKIDHNTFLSIIESKIYLFEFTNNLNLNIERNSFIELLFDFSGLSKDNKKNLDDSNIFVIKAIVKLGEEYFFDFYNGWRPIIDTILYIIYYQEKAKYAVNQTLEEMTRDDKNAVKMKNFEDKQKMIYFFERTRDLNILAFVGFLESFLDIIYAEINTFGLRSQEVMERLVYLIKINLDRNEFDLLLIWKKITHFYYQLMNSLHHSNSKMFIFSLDILKQLIFIFFEKETSLYCPNNFFFIFEMITSHENVTNEILEYVIFLLLNFLKKKHKQLNNGLDIFFKIFKNCLTKVKTTKEDNIIEFDIANLVKDGIFFIFENIEFFLNLFDSKLEDIFEIVSLLSLKKNLEIVDNAFSLFLNLFYIFWNEKEIFFFSFSKEVLLKLKTIKEKSDKPFFVCKNTFFKILILPNLKKMVNFEYWRNEDRFTKILQKIFELISKLESNFNDHTWSVIFDDLFNEIYNQIHSYNLPNFSQKLLIFIYKEIFHFCLSSPVREELIKKIYKIFSEQNKKKNSAFVDCLILNLGQNVLEINNFKFSENNIYEEKVLFEKQNKKKDSENKQIEPYFIMIHKFEKENDFNTLIENDIDIQSDIEHLGHSDESDSGKEENQKLIKVIKNNEQEKISETKTVNSVPLSESVLKEKIWGITIDYFCELYLESLPNEVF